MPEREAATSIPLHFIWGEDDYAVQRRSRQLFADWTRENPGADLETIEGTAGTVDEALKVLAKVREALQTLPFFGGLKSIWLKDCTFLGEDRVSESATVVEALAEFARELGAFRWTGVRMLISAGKVDRRRSFYKTLDKIAQAEHLPGLTAEDRDWQDKAESMAENELKALGKRIRGEPLAALVERVGPQARQLASESQKLATYVGDRVEIVEADVEAVVTRGRNARAFAFADAVAERKLAEALRHLRDELWALQTDKQRSAIGLLYGLISKFRVMLLAREMIKEGLLRPLQDYRAFAAQLKQLPPDRLPVDKRYNPAVINAYVLFRAAMQSTHYTTEELVSAMEELLQANRRLVGSGMETDLVFQLAITRVILGDRPGAPTPAARQPRLDARGGHA
ncbi:MAG: DNA polymerase III subunit delta [Verrucomicrobiales bacterium]|nr:DNA polymerase III subunit delta [Verrucomicrobiales bacterium]